MKEFFPSPHDDDNSPAAQIARHIRSLPEDEQDAEIARIITEAIQRSPYDKVLLLRQNLEEHLDPEDPNVVSLVDLIDGHLALRAMSGDKWGRVAS